jgi:hypothetical protein
MNAKSANSATKTPLAPCRKRGMAHQVVGLQAQHLGINLGALNRAMAQPGLDHRQGLSVQHLINRKAVPKRVATDWNRQLRHVGQQRFDLFIGGLARKRKQPLAFFRAGGVKIPVKLFDVSRVSNGYGAGFAGGLFSGRSPAFFECSQQHIRVPFTVQVKPLAGQGQGFAFLAPVCHKVSNSKCVRARCATSSTVSTSGNNKYGGISATVCKTIGRRAIKWSHWISTGSARWPANTGGVAGGGAWRGGLRFIAYRTSASQAIMLSQARWHSGRVSEGTTLPHLAA